ncbi:DUF1543 domain-containing protein [Frigoriflavimonas asaccharolytica]|uniref:DUF1543 domain-containing protein n=1 Tax=Frigoriflavimonas asaccharolytica TaxID=2735899 RepID=A0A8J8GA51_9FLAO|nr:DUF1543 domain-containing protein [Frigoriflavimonas asaccharolytica]NRS92772.1 hypothetical protein [Frigoriflavimonas asaccharolytica]
MKLFYVILGATPKGRNTEQHDVFFGIAENVYDLIKDFNEFWKEAKGKIHMDAYMEVNYIDGYEVKVVPKLAEKAEENLYFMNLGGYKPGVFVELHEQILMVGKSLSEITRRAKKTDFYKEMTFKNSESHIDDKYGVDVDDLAKVTDLLPKKMKEKYSIILEKNENSTLENEINIGYFKLKKPKI